MKAARWQSSNFKHYGRQVSAIRRPMLVFSERLVNLDKAVIQRSSAMGNQVTYWLAFASSK
jgi:hypothetical protein